MRRPRPRVLSGTSGWSHITTCTHERIDRTSYNLGDRVRLDSGSILCQSTWVPMSHDELSFLVSRHLSLLRPLLEGWGLVTLPSLRTQRPVPLYPVRREVSHPGISHRIETTSGTGSPDHHVLSIIFFTVVSW